MVAFRHLIVSLVGAFSVAQIGMAAGLFEADHSLVARAAVNGNICATIDLVLLGITVVRGVCLCAQGGVLTPQSVLTINQQVTANQGVLAPVINLVGGLSGAITTITANALPLPTSCRYPANATPNACGSCGYACFTNSTVTYVPCGASCILQGAPCVSGIPGRKREVTSSRISFDCPRGLEACLIPGRPGLRGEYECIDTSADLESCGGCVSPFPGGSTGIDCSSIPNVGSSSCVKGQCRVESCLKGYNLEGSRCVKSNRPLVGYWAALEDSARMVLAQ